MLYIRSLLSAFTINISQHFDLITVTTILVVEPQDKKFNGDWLINQRSLVVIKHEGRLGICQVGWWWWRWGWHCVGVSCVAPPVLTPGI